MKAQDVIKKNNEKSVIDRFYKLYKKGRQEKGVASGLVDYFEARKFLLDEIQHSHTSLTQAISEDLEEKRKDLHSVRGDKQVLWMGYNQALSQVQEYLKKLI